MLDQVLEPLLGEAEGRFAITALVLAIAIRLAFVGVVAAVALKVFLS